MSNADDGNEGACDLLVLVPMQLFDCVSKPSLHDSHFITILQSLPLLVMQWLEVSLLLTPTLLKVRVVVPFPQEIHQILQTHWDPKMLCE